MKIAYICDNDLSIQAGDTVHIVEICENFARLGHAVTLYAPRLGRYQADASFSIVYIPTFRRGPGRFLVYQCILFFRLLFDVLQTRPDLIYARANWAPISLVISRITRKPIVIEIQVVNIEKKDGRAPMTLKERIFDYFERINIDSADRIVTTTEENRGRLKERFSVSPDKIDVVACGVDVGVFDRIDQEQACEQLSLDNGAQYVGFIGTIFEYSAIELLIECFPSVLEYIPNARILLVGKDETKGSIDEKVRVHKLGGNVVRVGEAPRADIPLYMSVLSIGVELKRHTDRIGRTDPIKLYEYFASGKPVVTSMPYRDLVEAASAGIAVDIDDTKNISSAVITLLKDRKRRVVMGESGRRYVREHRTWRQASLKTLHVCEKTIKAVAR